MLLLLLLSRFSRVRLCATPQTAAHQAPPSLGFSRQEHWNGLPFPSPTHESENESEVAQPCPTPSDPTDCSPPGPSFHGIFQARVLEWDAIAFSVRPDNWLQILDLPCYDLGPITPLNDDFLIFNTSRAFRIASGVQAFSICQLLLLPPLFYHTNLLAHGIHLWTNETVSLTALQFSETEDCCSFKPSGHQYFGHQYFEFCSW